MKVSIFILTASLSFTRGFNIQRRNPSVTPPSFLNTHKSIPKSSSPQQSYIPRLQYSSNTVLSSSTSTDNAAGYSLQVMDRDENSIAKAATFMMDAFWLQPSQIFCETSDETSGDAAISSESRAKVEESQRDDLREKYGERMGKRILNSCIISANDEENMSDILGMVCIEGMFIVI